MIAGAVASVIDFGAVGNGTTNDRAALAAAEAAGAGIYLPPGVYRVSASITLSKVVTFAPGAILKPDSGITITLSGEIDAGMWQIFDTSAGGTFAGPVRNQLIYPDWWGAVPNIPTNQSPNIQAAITFAQAGARTVYLRNGMWRCDTTLFMREPAGIVGDPGISSQGVDASISTLDFSSAASGVSGLVIGRTNDFPLDGCTIQDIAIYRSTLAPSGSGSFGMILKSVRQAECINVQIWNFDRGYSLQGTATWACSMCEFRSCRSTNAGTIHWDIWSAFDCAFDRCQAGGGTALYCVYIYPNANASLPNALHWTNGTFVGNTGDGIRILTGFWHNIENCVFEEFASNGILISMAVQDLSLLNVSVIDCWFNNCGNGIGSVGSGGNFRFDNNRIELSANKGTTGIGIDSASSVAVERDVTISGNIVKVNSATQTGISLQRISGAHIYGNRIYCANAAAAQPGIFLGGLCQNSIVSQNRSYTTHADAVGISNNGPNNLMLNNLKG
jgi:hypothetical protein